MGRTRLQPAEKNKSTRRRGKYTPVVRKFRRTDGTILERWGIQFAADVWKLLPDGRLELVRDNIRRRGDSAKHCEEQMAAFLEENDRYSDWVVSNNYPRVTINEWRTKSVVSPVDTVDKQTLNVSSVATANLGSSINLATVADRYKITKGRYDGEGNYEEVLSPSYMKRVDVYVRSFGTLLTRPIDQLTRQDVDQWFRAYQLSHKQNTVSRYRAWLIPLGDFAVACSYWKANLFASLPKVSAQRQADKPTLTFQEIDKIWNEAATNANLAALFVLLRFGLRIGEALALTSECLNDDGSILVKYNLSEIPNDKESIKSNNKMLPYLGSTKTRTSAAKVRIPKQWMPLLRQSLARAKPMLIRAFDDVDNKSPREHFFVISNNQGICWRDESAKRGVNKLLDKVGVDISSKGHSLAHEPVNHIWRYTYCSELVALGANDIELQSLMRHTDANTSKQIYAQIRLEDKQLYNHYHKQVSTLHDYNQAIADMDEDRRAGINPLVVQKPPVIVTAPLSFSITPGTPMPALPKPKTGLGGFIGADGSTKVDV